MNGSNGKMEQWKREKNVNDQPNAKPERATTSHQNQRIVEFFVENPGITLNQAVEQLSRENIHVSRSTLRRRLQAKIVQPSSNHQNTGTDTNDEKRRDEDDEEEEE